LKRAIEGFDRLGVSSDAKASASAHLERWLDGDEFVAFRPQIEGLIQRGAWDLLLESFYQLIPFGTGGRRGPVGVGPNRINPWTIATSVQGHVDYLRDRFPRVAHLGVVVAYDVRCFRDRNGLYDPVRPNPLLGMTSRDLAELAARVYAANGVRVHIQRRGDPRYVSTPELSFAIRALRAEAGLNVSASHNPPDDNGGKFYNDVGGQEIPPDDEAMVARVEQVTQVHLLSWQKAKDSGMLATLSDEVHRGYLHEVASRSLAPSRSAKVVFTPLHGSGVGTVPEVLRSVGFDVVLVEAQVAPDGDFPTVPFRTPNPEVPRSMDIAVALAEQVHGDVVMATDPDADRIGAVVRHGGGWRFLSGNEIATLVVHHAIARGPWNGHRPLILQTEVTSGFVSRLARALGAQVVDNLLVGFKYIGDALRQIEATGRFAGLEASVEDFAAGVEESHGILVTPHIRDKDAAGGALYLAEAAAVAKDEGRTLVDVLEDLWRQYGYVSNRLVSTAMRGAVGRARIQAVQDSFRDRPPSRIGGLDVTAFLDRRDPSGPFGPIKSETDRASRDVLVFELGEDARVILRPSGTEPKNKAYVEVRGRKGVGDLVAERARVDAEAERLAEAFVDEMLGRVGLILPSWAHGISDLVAVEGKITFAGQTMPELVRRVTSNEPVDAWLDEALRPLGHDGRRLVDRAVARWIAGGSAGREVNERLRGLFAI
jgi:phosphoglucomutase/phosphomannomutase